jgi:hypothetical protein
MRVPPSRIPNTENALVIINCLFWKIKLAELFQVNLRVVQSNFIVNICKEENLDKNNWEGLLNSAILATFQTKRNSESIV